MTDADTATLPVENNPVVEQEQLQSGKYKKADEYRFKTYNEAKDKFHDLTKHNDRVRVRRRSDGFSTVVYKER